MPMKCGGFCGEVWQNVAIKNPILQIYDLYREFFVKVASIELKSQPIHSKAVLLNKKIH